MTGTLNSLWAEFVYGQGTSNRTASTRSIAGRVDCVNWWCTVGHNVTAQVVE